MKSAVARDRRDAPLEAEDVAEDEPDPDRVRWRPRSGRTSSRLGLNSDRGRSAERIPIGSAIIIHAIAPPNTREAVTGAALADLRVDGLAVGERAPEVLVDDEAVEEAQVLDVDRLCRSRGNASPGGSSRASGSSATARAGVGRNDEEDVCSDDRDGDEEHDRPEQPSDDVANHLVFSLFTHVRRNSTQVCCTSEEEAPACAGASSQWSIGTTRCRLRSEFDRRP